jgi:hypothetical protein
VADTGHVSTLLDLLSEQDVELRRQAITVLTKLLMYKAEKVQVRVS